MESAKILAIQAGGAGGRMDVPTRAGQAWLDVEVNRLGRVTSFAYKPDDPAGSPQVHAWRRGRRPGCTRLPAWV